MLSIDRVQTEMEVLPGRAGADGGSAGSLASTRPGLDPALRAMLRREIDDVLREKLRELERRGIA